MTQNGPYPNGTNGVDDSGNGRRKRRRFWRTTPFLFGIVLTVAVLWLFTWALSCFPVITPEANYPNKWSYLKASPPNEIGDTLAGVAGSLAFVWLVITVVLQATELKEQREEFEKMAIAQNRQVELLEVQGAIFQDEQRQRQEDRARRELEARIAIITRILKDLNMGFREIEKSTPRKDSIALNIPSSVDDPDDLLRNIGQVIKKFNFDLRAFLEKHQVEQKSEKEGDLREINRQVRSIRALKNTLASSQVVRLEYCRLTELEESIAELLELNVWKMMPPKRNEDNAT